MFVALLTCMNIASTAQQNDPAKYPKDFFRNPLDIPILLAGNFGECRPNHFHGGIDIKTDGKENLPVHAAAEGYISRVKIEKGGYGHAIYVTHPYGYTTVYGHLNNFMPAIQRYVKKEQYAKENWEVDLQFYPQDFPVKKGDIIAYSGNTGASTAPHLHFEIRGADADHGLNPQLFGLDIKDKIPPKPTKLALYNMMKSIYEQTPKIYELQKKDSAYWTIPDTIEVRQEQTGVGLVMNDYMDGSDNTLTYYTADLYLNNAITLAIKMDYIGHHDTRYLNAYIDYKTKELTGEWIQCMFQLDGNKFDHIYGYTSEYRRLTQRGRLELAPGQLKLARTEVQDANGNKTNIMFYIKYTTPDTTPKLPCEHPFNFNKRNSYSNEKMAVVMDDNSLYQNICFDYSSKPDANNYSDRFEIHHAYVPVEKEFGLYLNTNKPVPENLKGKIALMYSNGESESGMGAEPNDGWYKANVRKFGTYWLAIDTTAPEITAEQKEGSNLSKAAGISFNVKETTTSVKTFVAKLDGKWLPFEQSGSRFTYNFDDHCPKGKHKLDVTATDENGNSSNFIYNFTR